RLSSGLKRNLEIRLSPPRPVVLALIEVNTDDLAGVIAYPVCVRQAEVVAVVDVGVDVAVAHTIEDVEELDSDLGARRPDVQSLAEREVLCLVPGVAKAGDVARRVATAPLPRR